jgi:hypothetical protein
MLRPLDYAGLPNGEATLWPGRPGDRWPIIDRQSPARVAGLSTIPHQRITLQGDHVDVQVEWQGAAMCHALLWEELGVSVAPPWHGQVMALGIEPTSAPHGAGTALGESLVRLAPGDSLEWSVSLSVRWASTPDTPEEP